MTRLAILDRSALLRAALLVGAVLAAACESAPVYSGPSPFMAAVGGVWDGAMTLQAASGGECVGDAVRDASAGVATPIWPLSVTDRVELAVTQNGAQAAATATPASTGLACSYTGAVTLNSLVLDASSCEAELLVVKCPDGSVRDLKLVGSTISVNVRGAAADGTMAQTYNMFETGKNTGVATLVLNYRYTALRR